MSRTPVDNFLRRPVGRPRNPEPITLQVQLGPDAIRALSAAVRLTADDIESICEAVGARLGSLAKARAAAEPQGPAHPNEMQRAASLITYCGLSKTLLWRRIRAGTFPQGFHIGVTARGWFTHELDAMNAARARGATEDELRELTGAIVSSRANAGGEGWPPTFKLPERKPQAKRPRGRPPKAPAT